MLSLLRSSLWFEPVDQPPERDCQTRTAPTEGHAAQVERVRSLAQCASDLSKKHDVVGAAVFQTMLTLCLLPECYFHHRKLPNFWHRKWQMSSQLCLSMRPCQSAELVDTT